MLWLLGTLGVDMIDGKNQWFLIRWKKLTCLLTHIKRFH